MDRTRVTVVKTEQAEDAAREQRVLKVPCSY